MVSKKNRVLFPHCARLLGCIIVSILVAGCSPAHYADKPSRGEDEAVLRNLIVIPFHNIIPDDPSATFVRCPVSGTYFSTIPYSGNPEKVIEKNFLQKLQSGADVNLIQTDRVSGVYKRVSSDSFKAKPMEIFQRVGREMGADGVLAGYVYRYRERIGYEYSVKQPASVAFGVYLLRVSDGTFVWKGVFDKTQSSLMENVLDVKSFIKGGGRWMTAEQLSAEGVDTILKTFPQVKNK